MTDLLQGLNDEQRMAVQHTQGPLLALAGAGTGKTHVLITRIAYIIQKHDVDPDAILAVTFTNKAASEMRERLSRLCGTTHFWWCGTFHSLAVKILRKHIHMLGHARDFTIVDIDDQVRLLEGIIDDHFSAHNQPFKKRELAKKILDIIQRWKDKGLWSHQVVDEVVSDSGVLSAVMKIAQKAYPIYQSLLMQMHCLDYGDILLFCVRLFQENEAILSIYQNQFQYVCVDEFQDTNALQDLWVSLLAAQHKNLFCVGDDDQSIYRWRGADIGNILSFADRYKDAVVVRLEKNYRSTQPILSAATALIAHNRHRLGKTLWTDRKGGDLLKVRGFWSAKQEGSWIALRILSLVKHDVSPHNIAVLVRSNYLTRSYEDALTQMRIPYRVIGGMRFYDRMEIKDILAYLRLVLHPYDDLAFQRCCNMPRRGLGEAKIAQIRAYARERSSSYTDALKDLLDEGVIKGSAAKKVMHFLDCLCSWRSLLKQESLSHVLRDIVERSGYGDMIMSEESVSARSRMENIQELYTASEDFDSAEQFLEHIGLMTSADMRDAESMVNIMTIHAAKGLEFAVCFMVAWERDVFPTRRATDSMDVNALEEERRLAYVALTRAKDVAYITFVSGDSSGFNRGKGASRFLREIPRNLLETHDVSERF